MKELKTTKTYEEQLRVGLKVEREHSDVTDGDMRQIRKIAEAHLREDPKYYTKLEKAKL